MLIISWEYDDLGVQSEINELRQSFVFLGYDISPQLLFPGRSWDDSMHADDALHERLEMFYSGGVESNLPVLAQ